MLKKLSKAILVAVMSFSVSAIAVAENQYYAGGGFAFLDYSEDGFDDASLNSIYGRLGIDFNENFSGELRVGFGIGDDSVDVFGTDVDVELDNFFGAYVRGGIPVADTFFPYIVAGFTRGEVTVSASGFGSESESETDVSFGLGADVKVSDSFILNVEYINYFDKDSVEIDGFSLSAVTNF